jgi:hypothetical protein
MPVRKTSRHFIVGVVIISRSLQFNHAIAILDIPTSLITVIVGVQQKQELVIVARCGWISGRGIRGFSGRRIRRFSGRRIRRVSGRRIRRRIRAIDKVYDLTINLRYGNSHIPTASTTAMMKCDDFVSIEGYNRRPGRPPFSITCIANVFVTTSTTACAVGCRLYFASTTRVIRRSVEDANLLVPASSVLRDVDTFSN